MATVMLELPEKALAALHFDPSELADEVRLAAAALWYEQGKLSQEVAACVAGMDRTDFLLALARMGRSSFHVDWRDLDKELARG